MTIKLSLIICTYNRARYVCRLLLSLDHQSRVYDDVEIVVVDNNSIDDTRQTVERFIAGKPFIRYGFEPKQGLSHARNCGAAMARGSHLLYLDDDAVAQEGFVRAMRLVVVDHDPDLFGGPIFPLYAARRPEWFPESLEVRLKAPTSGFHPTATISGGNFGIRKSILDEIGGFDPRYGMTGNKVGMLEERLVVDAYKTNRQPHDIRLYYCLEGRIFHHTPAARMTKKFQVKRLYLADYQFTLHNLDSGVRNATTFYKATFARFAEVAKSRLWTMIAPPKTAVERFENIVRMTYGFARLRASIEHLLTRGAGNRRTPLGQAPRLRLLWVKGVESGKAERKHSREAKDHRLLEEIFTELDVEYRVLDFTESGYKPKQAYQAIVAAPASAFDAVLFENDMGASVGENLRIHYPHLQILLRLQRTRLFKTFDFAPQPLRGLRSIVRHFAPLRLAQSGDAENVRLSDKIICTCLWDMDAYLRRFGPKNRFVYTPPALPSDVARRMRPAREKKPKQIVLVTDVKTSVYDDRNAATAFAVFKASGAAKDGWRVEQFGKLSLDRNPPPGITLNRLGGPYVETLAESAILLMGAGHRTGQPSRYTEAACCGLRLVVPKGVRKRLDPRLRPSTVEYLPHSPESLRTALGIAARIPAPPENLNAIYRAECVERWRSVFDECRTYIRPAMARAADAKARPRVTELTAAPLRTIQERASGSMAFKETMSYRA